MSRYVVTPQEGRDYIVLAVLLWSLALLTLILRFCSRRIAKASLWWDDWISAVSMLFCTSLLGLYIASGIVSIGTNEHPDIPTARKLVKIGFVTELLYIFEITTAKCSVICFYWRIFSKGAGRSFRIAICALSAFVVVWFLTGMFLSFTDCRPINNTWDGVCSLTARTAYMIMAVPNMVTDVFIVALPVPYVLKLQMPLAQKIGLLHIFALGSLVTIISIYRTVIIWQLGDGLYITVDIYVWTLVEYELASTSINLPSLGPLVRLARDRWHDYASTRLRAQYSYDRKNAHRLGSLAESSGSQQRV